MYYFKTALAGKQQSVWRKNPLGKKGQLRQKDHTIGGTCLMNRIICSFDLSFM